MNAVIKNVPAKPPVPVKASKMRLDAIVKGKQQKPLRVVLYGPEGVGKSTFAANSPSPIFLGAEDGTARLNVDRLPEPESTEDILDAVRLLTNEKHDYKSFVLDTLDWAEPLIFKRVCERGDDRGRKKERIEDFGYGKGYTAAIDEWRLLLHAMARMQETTGMHVILLAHSQIKTFHNPEGDDYDRYQMKLNEKASGLFREWSEDVLFAKYETFKVGVDGNTNTRKAKSSGARIVHTERDASWDAKNRNNLPLTIPLSWDDYMAAVLANATEPTEKLVAQIEALLPRLNGDAESAKTLLEKNKKDAVFLARLLDRCRAKARIGIEETTDIEGEAR